MEEYPLDEIADAIKKTLEFHIIYSKILLLYNSPIGPHCKIHLV